MLHARLHISKIFPTHEASFPIAVPCSTTDDDLLVESDFFRGLWGDSESHRTLLEAGGDWDVSVEAWKRVESADYFSDDVTFADIVVQGNEEHHHHPACLLPPVQSMQVSRWRRGVSAKRRVRGTPFGKDEGA
jgi:hypothetical protein